MQYYLNLAQFGVDILGEINITLHQIKPEPWTESITQCLYQTVPVACDFEAKKVERIREDNR